MAGKDHFHVMLIAVVNGLLVFYRSSWLDDALDSCLMGFLNAIGKWEERIGSQNGILGIKTKRFCFVNGLFKGINSRRLSRSRPDELLVFHQNNGVTFGVFHLNICEKHVLNFFSGWFFGGFER